MRERVRRIHEKVAGKGQDVDVVLLVNGVEPHLDMSLFYATDAVTGGMFERSAALLWPDGRCDFLTSSLEEASARRSPGASVEVYRTNEERDAFLQSRLAGARRIGVNAAEITHANYLAITKLAPKETEIVDVSKAVAQARLVKDARELERIQRAADIASEVATLIPTLLKEGLKEHELSAEINYEMARRGASGPSFPTIVGFGAGSAEPHYSPRDVPLTRGAFVLCDFGAYVEHYASDLTRTFVFGTGSAEQRDIHRTVLSAQQAALDAIRPGAKGGDVHNAAAEVIDASPWKGRFIHSVGHALGLAVHDGPALHPRHDLTLEEGMVVTVEPGIYVPDLGGVRIEDDVVVTSDGCRLLTSAKKDYTEV